MTALFIITLIAFCILAYEFSRLQDKLDAFHIEREYFLIELEEMAQKLFKATGERTGWYHNVSNK